jgi:hypothetical protein
MRMKPWLLLLLISCLAAWADDLAALVRDRAAIERVYYNHRLGQKPPFEEALPPAMLENLVRQDLKKETALRKTYGVAITPAMLDAEVQRINTTTRAPEILAEIKAALGNDVVKFAQAFAKPFLVEGLLRERFDNDDALHAAQRHEAERVREKLVAQNPNPAGRASPRAPISPEARVRGDARSAEVVARLVALLKASHSNEVSETTWQLTPRPAETNAAVPEELEIKKRFGPNAQIISSPSGADRDRKAYFDELPPALQDVLRVQLNQPGDVSAVIEAPTGFLLYLCTGKTPGTLSAAVLSLRKRNYDHWLTEQNR